MKKDLKTLLAIAAVIIISIILAIITIIQYKNKEVEERLDDFGKVTFSFIGDSEHFNFDTGKFYFKVEEYESEYNKKLLITDFEQTSKIDGLIYEKLTIYFGDKVWKSVEKNIGLNKVHEVIEDFNFYEEELNSLPGLSSNKKGSLLNIIHKDNFKSALRMEMEYCTIEDECEVEVFSIDYKD